MKITLHENITAYLQDKNIIPNYPASGHGVICEVEDEVLAYLYYSLNPYHPSALYLRFAVPDKDVNAGKLVEMYEKLKTTLPLSDVILEVHRNHGLYEKLINTYGFTEFRKTYEPEVEISEMINHFNDGEVKVTSAVGKFELTEELLDFSRKVYESAHDLNPLREMTLTEWEDLVTDDLDHEHSIVLHDENDAVTAYILIYENDETSVDVGYCYFKDPDSKQSLISNFKDTLLNLQENDYEYINLEVDTTDEYAYEFFNDFVADTEPALVSYISRQR